MVGGKATRYDYIQMEGLQVSHTVFTAAKLGCQKVYWRNFQNVLRVICSTGVLEYQKNMDVVDRGNQRRTVGAVLICPFTKCHKKDFLAIAKFILLQKFNAWNMLNDDFKDIGRGGVLRLNYLMN